MPPDPAASDEHYMRLAIDQAERARAAGEVPVGAVVVDEAGAVLGQGHNRREHGHDPLGHAELIAIAGAARARQAWRLVGCTLYVTLEPCVMCAGAVIQARVERVVYGAPDMKAGACGGMFDIFAQQGFNHYPSVEGGVLADQCGKLLSDFFARLRSR